MSEQRQNPQDGWQSEERQQSQQGGASQGSPSEGYQYPMSQYGMDPQMGGMQGGIPYMPQDFGGYPDFRQQGQGMQPQQMMGGYPMMPGGQMQGGQMMQQPGQPMQMQGGQMMQQPGQPMQGQGGQMMPPPGSLPLPANQQSYIENILRLNLEKVATVYCTFENNSEWNAKVFKGEVEAAGRDHVIINDGGPQGTRYLIPLIYVDYITFKGPINYSYPYA